jgi:hypothetical protein
MSKDEMTQIDGCQIPGIPRMAEVEIQGAQQSLIHRVKHRLAVPWNYYVKRWLKTGYHLAVDQKAQRPVHTSEPLKAGDQVRVRSWEEIQATLDPFKELRGCAFLPEMKQFCGTTQRVFQVMERFLDERDYKVKKVKGIVLLEGVICRGTPVFGRCDRSCLLFWREEWLQKM